ncbi:MAG: HAMP domain-containing histidine kinase, partial [Methanosarcinaceae archaeon]|nr:HAMP domain-containing histidine kinase [Methanosarcinaceae archaeon]
MKNMYPMSSPSTTYKLKTIAISILFVALLPLLAVPTLAKEATSYGVEGSITAALQGSDMVLLFCAGSLILIILLTIPLYLQVKKRISELYQANNELEKDIRMLELSEQEAQHYVDELKLSNEFKDTFTDILRHDLLNPANVIKGFTRVLQRDESDEQKQRFLQLIQMNNDRIINLIENAAQFAKLESFEMLDMKRIELNSIIKMSIEGLRFQINEKHMKTLFEPSHEHYVMANQIIDTVFINLISNAIKYSPENSKIHISIQDKNEFWKITVTDSGEGIPDEDKEYIFDRFRRVNKTDVKGTGLGLAIVKKVVDLHGGLVGVEDNPGGKG